MTLASPFMNGLHETRFCSASCHYFRMTVNLRLVGILAVFTSDCSRLQRFVHNLPDGRGAASALRAASETAVDLAGLADSRIGTDSGADVVVAENVAGADDH